QGITVTSSASITDVDVVDNTFTYVANEGTKLTNYNISVAYGKLEVTKRNVSLTSATDSQTYNGLPLTNSTVTVGGDGFADGEGCTFDVTGTITNAGQVDNTFTYTLNEGTKAGNYNISKTEGKLTVAADANSVVVTVTANSDDTPVYDGQPHTLSGYTISSTNALYGEGDFTYSGTAQISETDAGTYEWKPEAGSFANTNANFTNVTFVVVPGSLEIAPRALTLTSATDSKTYDGTALTNNGVTVSDPGFVTGDAVAYSFTGTVTDPDEGAVQNKFTWEFTSGKATNYTITPAYGTLSINKVSAPITITAKNVTKVYDGTALNANGYEFTQGILANGDVLAATVAGTTGADVSTGTSRISGYKVVRTSDNKDVTGNYTFATTVDGTLEITARPVTLTSVGKSMMYDGTELKNEEVTISTGTNVGFVGTDGATYSNFAGQTTVTTGDGVDNTFDYTLKDGTNANNYTISQVYGKLKVYDRDVKYEVTVTAKSGSQKYDGTALTVSGFENETANGIPVTVTAANGTTVNYLVTGLTSEATVTNVADSIASIPVGGTAVVKDSAGNDVTSQFIVKTTPGYATISARTVTLTSATKTWEWNDEDFFDHNVTVSGDGFAGEEGVDTYTFDESAKVRYAGETAENKFTYTLKTGTDANNYSITKTYGQLTVTNRSEDTKYIIYIDAKSGNYVYNGEAHTVNGFVTDTFTAANGNTYTVSGLTATASLTNAGSTSVNVNGTAVVEDAGGNDVTGSFKVIARPGTLTISPRKVSITSLSDEKEYDGYSLEKNEVTYETGDDVGFVGSDTAIITYTGSQLLVGTSPNFFTYELAEGVIADNYDISVAYGTLNVTNRNAKYEITITANSGEFVYDGTEKTVEGFETNEFVVNGNKYTVSGLDAKAAGTDAGTYQTTITGVAVVKDTAGNDVSDQFAVSVVEGKLTIKGIYTLTINYVDASGTKLADSYVGNFVEGDSFGPINSPEVEGYTPAYRAIYSDEGGMPARDVEINVLYTANAVTDEEDDDNGNGTDNEPVSDDDDTGKDGVKPTVDDKDNDTGKGGVTPNADDTTTDGTTGDTTGGTPQLTTPVTPNGDGDGTDVANGDTAGGDGTTVDDETVPAGKLTIDADGNPTVTQLGEDEVPLAANNQIVWALINLLATIFTALITLLLLFTYFTKKKEDDEKINNTEGEVMDEDEEDRIKRRGFLRLFSIVPTVVSVILFVLTEDMTGKMVLTDKWTLCMVIILILQMIIAFYATRKSTEKNDNMTADTNGTV
nr:hypothetical protein [Lachnospiraceae bacterium]